MVKFQSFLSGSSGNSTFITDDTTNILADCGANGKYMESCFLRLGVNPKSLNAIFISHEHTDHISGAGIISRRYDVPIYATAGTWAEMEGVLGKIAEKNKKTISPEKPVTIGNIEVLPFSVPHDAAQPVCYSFSDDECKFTVATDMGYVTEELLKNLKGSDFAVIEANHDEQMLKNGRYHYPLKKRILGENGHLSNESAANLCKTLAESGTKSFWLGHLSLENNTPKLAYDAVSEKLNKLNKKDVSLCVLPRYWVR